MLNFFARSGPKTEKIDSLWTGRGIGHGHGDGKQNSLTRSILVTCNSDIGIALMYHEACLKESFD